MRLQSQQLQKEVETLQIQIERNAELHQIELQERDLQLEQLRRQLKYAVLEEEETRRELKVATNEFASEKLSMQKKIVELDSKLQLVDTSLSEWRENALERESELRTLSRQSKLKVRHRGGYARYRSVSLTLVRSRLRKQIQLLEDQLEVAMAAANATKAKVRRRCARPRRKAPCSRQADAWRELLC